VAWRIPINNKKEARYRTIKGSKISSGTKIAFKRRIKIKKGNDLSFLISYSRKQ
jgi:hypothetical protein